MKILTKLTLANAMMVTSGFADPGDTILGASGDVAELNGVFGNTNYIARNGGAINVKGNTTVPAGQSITIESKGVGTVAEAVVLSNEGVVAMHWADADADRGLVAGDGSINQVIVEGGPKTVRADFDKTGEAEWYVYNYTITPWGGGELYGKESGVTTFPYGNSNWFFKADHTNGEVYCVTSGIYEPLSSGDLKDFFQAYNEAKNGSIVINNVEKLEYIAANSAVLDADTTTNLTGTDLNGKNPKLVAVSENFAFNPPIPSTIANVTLNGGTNLLESPEDGKITDDTTMAKYFSDFGVSFKKADETTASDMEFVAARSVIDAIASGTVAEAVLLNQTDGINVDATAKEGDSIAIVANLHSIGNTTGVKFSGTKGLDLSGNNELLANMTADCPVQISGANAMPGNSTFSKGLRIAESVTTPYGITTVTGDFTVESGNTFTVKGTLIVGTPIVKE